MRPISLALLLPGLSAALLLAGCSGDGLVPASGAVLVDGQPLARGSISFQPVPSGPVGVGAIAADGSFTIRTGDAAGLRPGEYRVTVVATGDPPPAAPGAPELPPPLLIPARYGNPETSGLRFTIPAAGPIEIRLQGR